MMTQVLLTFPVPDLLAISIALRTSRIVPPYTSSRLLSVLPKIAADTVAPALQELADKAFTPEQLATTLELIARGRLSQSRVDDDLELVTTGPEATGVTNRDTSVVVRELFASAERSVLVAGYAVYQGQRVFQALADRMSERPELSVRLFLDIQRPQFDSSIPGELAARFADRFRSQQWPQNRPIPSVFYDPRALDLGGDKRACLHAKSVVVDGRVVFITSANFTEAAQERNIEIGLLIRNELLAERVTSFFDSMLEARLLERVL